MQFHIFRALKQKLFRSYLCKESALTQIYPFIRSMIFISLFLIPFSLYQGGCVSVPKGAFKTNEAVTKGVERLKDQHIATVRAYANAVRASVEYVWDDEIVYKTIDAVNSDPNHQFTRDEIAAVTATAGEVKDKLLERIATKEQSLITSIQNNYNGLIEINSVVSSYLASLETLEESQDAIQNRLFSSIGFSTDNIPDVVKELLNIAEQPQATNSSTQ